MFFYCKNGKHATKESLIAIAVSLELTVNETDKLLRSCGYCLSRSIPADAVAEWFISRRIVGLTGVDAVNETLGMLGLPFLGTHNKT